MPNPGHGHQLGRDPDDGLAGGNQVTFQAAGQVPAVLDGPHQPAAITERLSPPQQAKVNTGTNTVGETDPTAKAQITMSIVTNGD